MSSKYAAISQGSIRSPSMYGAWSMCVPGGTETHCAGQPHTATRISAQASLSVSTMLPSRARMADSTPLNHAARSYPERHPPQYFTWREGMARQPLSTNMAIPCPPPMHSVANPLLCPFRFSVCKSVTRIRAPEAPIGCPRAMAPPLTFTLSRLKPSSRPTARNWAAKASLASI